MSHHIKEKNKAKPYDPKKSVWVPNKADGGYLEGLVLCYCVLACIDCMRLYVQVTSSAGGKVSVQVGGEVKTFKEETVCQVCSTFPTVEYYCNSR